LFGFIAGLVFGSLPDVDAYRQGWDDACEEYSAQLLAAMGKK
jgi:hypothetical protein